MIDEATLQTETPTRQFYTKVRGQPHGETMTCALRFRSLPKAKRGIITVHWGAKLKARLKMLADRAAETGKDAGRSLPYASLRAALQVAHNAAMFVDKRVGSPFNADRSDAILGTLADEKDAVGAVRFAVQSWADTVLAQWAKRLELDERLREAFDRAIQNEDAFNVEARKARGEIDLADFPAVLDHLSALIAECLSGHELFEGLGPVRRVVRNDQASNVLEFQTWPQVHDGGAWSMLARIDIETFPGSGLPFIRLKASRRRWADAFPAASVLNRNGIRLVGVHILAKDISEIAAATHIPLHRGEPADCIDPALAIQNVRTKAPSPKGTLNEQIIDTHLASGPVFVGVPFASVYGSHRIGSGATTRDTIRLYEKVAHLLDCIGAEPVPFHEVDHISRKTIRYHKRISLDSYLHHVAGSLEAPEEEVDVDAAAERLKALLDLSEKPEFSADEREKTLESLKLLRKENAARIVGTYPHCPIVVPIAATERERSLIAVTVNLLFGDSVRVSKGYQLPTKGHGPWEDFPEITSFNDRYRKRYGIWKPVAEAVKAQANHGLHLLVQAPEWFTITSPDGKERYRHDDAVCKAAARTALAVEAGSNSQWLRPIQRGRNAIEDYLYRTQSAIYDLLLGHSGCIDPIDEALMAAFPNEETRPRQVIGISIVRLARLRNGGGHGGDLAVAFAVEPETRRTIARASWKDTNDPKDTAWKPLNEFLTEIASYPGLSLGETREDEQATFQRFVSKVIDEGADSGKRPLVMIDSTSSRSLWPSLKNPDITGRLEFPMLSDGGIDEIAWRHVRLVRVDSRISPRIAQRKTVLYQRRDPENGWQETGETLAIEKPTINNAILELVDGFLYWATGNYPSANNQHPRGRSVYRDVVGMTNVKRDNRQFLPGYPDVPKSAISRPTQDDNALIKMSYKLPSTLEIVVFKTADGDDPALIAGFVDDMRRGYGHHDSVTALPAPISFKNKLNDYIARYTLKEGEPEPDLDGEIDEGGDESEEASLPPSPERKPYLKRTLLSSAATAISAWAPLAVVEKLGQERDELPEEPGRDHQGARENAYQDNDDEEMLDDRSGGKAEERTGLTESEKEILTTPVEKLPSFADEEWVSKYIYFNQKILNAARMHADEIARCSGYEGWPTDKATLGIGKAKALPYILEGLHYPAFLRVFYLQAIRTFNLKLSHPNKRLSRKDHFFKIFDAVALRCRGHWPSPNKEGTSPDAHPRESMLCTLLENCFLDEDPEAALSLAFHIVLFPSLTYEFSEVVEILKENRDKADRPEDTDIIIEHGERLQLIDDFIFDSSWLQDNESTSSAEEENDEESADDDEQVYSEGEPVTTDATKATDGAASPKLTLKAQASEKDVLARWQEAIADIRVTVDEMKQPDWEAVVELREMVDELEALVSIYDAITSTISLVEIRARLSECHERLTQLGAKHVRDEHAVLKKKIKGLPDETASDADAIKAWVDTVEAQVVDVENVVEQRRNPPEFDDVDERDEFLSEIRERHIDKLNQAFSTLAETLDLLDGATPVRASTPNEVSEDADQIAKTSGAREDPHTDGGAETETSLEEEVRKADEDDFVDDIDDLPEMEAEMEDTGEAEPAAEAWSHPVHDGAEEEVEPLEETASDDIQIEQINRRLDELFAEQEFGAAYHLALSAENKYPAVTFNYTSAELFLVTCANHTQVTSYTDVVQYAEALNGALVAANELYEEPDHEDRTAARRIALLASTIELALFGGMTNPTSTSITDILVRNGVGDCFFPLNEAVQAASKSTVQISANSLFALESPEDRTYSNELLEALKSKLMLLRDSRRTYRVGRQVQWWLFHGGPFGELLEAIEITGDVEGAANTARRIGKQYLSREDADALINRAEREENTYTPVIDEGREWFINQITEIARLAVDWSASIIESKPKGHEELVLRKLANQIVKGSESALGALDGLVEKHGLLVAAAAEMATRVLARLRGLATGEAAPKVDITRAMIGLHGPLLWIPRIFYAGEWMPSPYQVDVIISAILQGNPVPRAERHKPEVFENVVHDRIDEGSFLAARLLLKVGQRYDISTEKLDELRGILDDKRNERFVEVEARLDETLANVMRAQRSTIEHNNLLQDAYDRLEEVRDEYLKIKDGTRERSDVGGDIDPSDTYVPGIPEVADREVLRDFNAIETLIEDIENEIENVFELEKQPLIDRLNELEGKADNKEEFAYIRHEVEALIASQRDLAAADELLEHFTGDSPEPHRGMIRPEMFRAFFEDLDVPSTLENNPDYDLDSVRKAIESGSDYLNLPFSQVEEREESLVRLERWQEFRQVAMRNKISTQNVLASAASLLETLDFRGVEVTPEPSLSTPGRREHVGSMDLSVTIDRDSILLPDFGSMTGRKWRLAVYPNVPKAEKGDFTRLTEGPSHIGVMVLVPGLVTKREREKLATTAIKNGHKLLVIDESIFLYALSAQNFRPLTMLEIAQAFSYSDPYRDYQNYAVPPEMFKGRRAEYERLKNMNTGFIVYGGRRLGKTALLNHLAHQEHNEAAGALRVYIQVHKTAETRVVWREASRALSAIFPNPVDDREKFKTRVISWLEEDQRRSIILMIDECDDFVKLDEEDNFAAVKTLNDIMVSTNRRFKAILAGLQNVLRLTKNLENAPLTHMDSGILEIGPMIGKDVADAERLITAPLAGMGYHFANDRDVWQILSYCNYYPVLIQLVGESLVALLRDRVKDTGVLVREIDDALVHEVLNAPKTLKEIKRAFDKTLALDGERYKLLTYIIADHMIEMNSAHMTDDGMRATEVLDKAAYFWPAAFATEVTPEDIAGLLDEMVGLGLLQNIDGYRWTLRSRSTLAFIGGNRAVEDGLLTFDGKPRPQYLENTLKRRELGELGVRGDRKPSLRRSVLTIGQEYQIVQNKGRKPVLMFGHDLAGVDHVSACLRNFRKDLFHVSMIKAKTAKAFKNEIARIAPADDGKRQLLFVGADRDWDSTWVTQARRARVVRDGEMTIVFTGGASHAMKWAEVHPRTSPEIEIVTLEPWRRSFIAAFLDQGLVDDFDKRADDLLKMTGGWSGLIDDLCDNRIGNDNVDDRFQKKKRQIKANLDDYAGRLGIEGERALALRAIMKYEGGPQFHESDFLDAVDVEIGDPDRAPKAESWLAYYRLIGLVEVVPSAGDEKRGAAGSRYRINQLAYHLLVAESE